MEKKGSGVTNVLLVILILVVVIVGIMFVMNSKSSGTGNVVNTQQPTTNNQQIPVTNSQPTPVTATPQVSPITEAVKEVVQNVIPTINPYNEYFDFLFSCIKNCPKTSVLGIISVDCAQGCDNIVGQEKGIQLDDNTLKQADNNHQLKFNCMQACATYGGYKYDCTHTCLD